MQKPHRTALLEDLLTRRILFLDGAMGTMIQGHKLNEADYRGTRFADFPHDLRGNNDLLTLTQPQIIRSIHTAYLEAGADIVETNTFNSNAASMAGSTCSRPAFWCTPITSEDFAGLRDVIFSDVFLDAGLRRPPITRSYSRPNSPRTFSMAARMTAARIDVACRALDAFAEKRRQLFVVRARNCTLRKDGEDVRDPRIRDPHLLAVQRIRRPIGGEHSARPRIHRVRAGGRFR